MLRMSIHFEPAGAVRTRDTGRRRWISTRTIRQRNGCREMYRSGSLQLGLLGRMMGLRLRGTRPILGRLRTGSEGHKGVPFRSPGRGFAQNGLRIRDSSPGRSGETGRRAGLKIPWGSLPVWVRFPPPAPIAAQARPEFPSPFTWAWAGRCSRWSVGSTTFRPSSA
jgi:hypothetical protein